MKPTMTVEVRTPGWRETIGDLIGLRLEATDGARGVLPGHEPARVRIVAGPIEFSFRSGASRFLATDGGIASITHDGVVITSAWAVMAQDLPTLLLAVDEQRAALAQSVRAAQSLARQHEVKTRRALVALRRSVHG